MHPFCVKCNKNFASNYSYSRHVKTFHKQLDNEAYKDDMDEPTIFGCTTRELIKETSEQDKLKRSSTEPLPKSFHVAKREEDLNETRMFVPIAQNPFSEQERKMLKRRAADLFPNEEEDEDGEGNEESENDEEDENSDEEDEDEDKESEKEESKSIKRQKVCSTYAFSPIWAHWLVNATRRVGLRRWPELNDRKFLKEFCREAYEKCRMYQELIDNDEIYSQLKREEARLYHNGYTIPGEAWLRAWTNRKCLIKCLVEQLKADMQHG